MCHSNLDMDPERHGQLFGWRKRTSGRLFTLSQGQFEIHFPEGYGVPVLSNGRARPDHPGAQPQP